MVVAGGCGWLAAAGHRSLALMLERPPALLPGGNPPPPLSSEDRTMSDYVRRVVEEMAATMYGAMVTQLRELSVDEFTATVNSLDPNLIPWVTDNVCDCDECREARMNSWD